MILVFWLIFSLLAAILAGSKNRSVLGYFLLAIIISPLAAILAGSKNRSVLGYFLLAIIISPLLAIIIVSVLSKHSDTVIATSKRLGDSGEVIQEVAV